MLCFVLNVISLSNSQFRSRRQPLRARPADPALAAAPRGRAERSARHHRLCNGRAAWADQHGFQGERGGGGRAGAQEQRAHGKPGQSIRHPIGMDEMSDCELGLVSSHPHGQLLQVTTFLCDLVPLWVETAQGQPSGLRITSTISAAISSTVWVVVLRASRSASDGE